MKQLYTLIILLILLPLSSFGQIDPNKHVDEGYVDNGKYISEEIGWTIEIPEGWEIVTIEQNEEFQEVGLDAMEGLIEEDIDISGLKNLIGFQKNQFNLFLSTSEPFKVEYEGEYEENQAGLKELIYNAFMEQGIKVDSTETQIATLDGLDFYYYRFTIRSQEGEEILTQLIYSRLINGLDFTININYTNESDKNEMFNALLDSKFRY